MNSDYALELIDVYKAYGNKVILDNLDLAVRDGELCTLVGPSGAGKSTLLRLILGQEAPTSGRLRIGGEPAGFPDTMRGIVYQRYSLYPHLTVLDNVTLGHRLRTGLFERIRRRQEFEGEAFPAKGIKVGFLPQEPELDPAKDVIGNIEEAVTETKALLDRFNQVSDRFAEPLEADEMEKLLAEQADVQDAIDSCDGWEIDHTVEMAMDALRCPPGEAAVDEISGGERRRVALCRILLEKPDLLLLDEPTVKSFLKETHQSWDYSGRSLAFVCRRARPG
mgnify:CR=1 FL=1